MRVRGNHGNFIARNLETATGKNRARVVFANRENRPLNQAPKHSRFNFKGAVSFGRLDLREVARVHRQQLNTRAARLNRQGIVFDGKSNRVVGHILNELLKTLAAHYDFAGIFGIHGNARDYARRKIICLQFEH